VIIAHDVPLAPLTTLGVGGAAKRLARVTTERELVDVLGEATEPILVLGGGSNLVIGDAGWDGLVVQIATAGVTIEGGADSRARHAHVTASAGVVWDELVGEMVDARLAGIECLSGIPGLVGATPMQNVGAYGQEVSHSIVAVRAYDRERRAIVTMSRDECAFAYRTSVFRGSDRWVVLDVRFELVRERGGRADSLPIRYTELTRALGIREGERAPLDFVRRVVLALRRTKGMVVDLRDPESKSAGSFFTNPIVDAAVAARLPADTPRWPQPDGRTKLAAAWLIERAGFAKGYTVGNVGISRKHALALVNRGGATAHELLALARQIRDGVRDRLGVELVPEPVIVGAEQWPSAAR
jgi:UDP-N-acetylmuramate dehydrogenase